MKCSRLSVPPASSPAPNLTSPLVLGLCTLLLLFGCAKPEPSDDQQSSANQSPAAVQGAQNSARSSEKLALADMINAAAADPASTMYQSLQGQGFDISALKGKKVFLNFWATWCAPCIREIPAISRAAEALEDENFVFLLASDESLETISNFLEDREFSGNFIKLNGFFGGHGIDAVPSSVLYDEAGNQVSSWAGAFEWDSAEMLAELRTASLQ